MDGLRNRRHRYRPLPNSGLPFPVPKKLPDRADDNLLRLISGPLRSLSRHRAGHNHKNLLLHFRAPLGQLLLPRKISIHRRDSPVLLLFLRSQRVLRQSVHVSAVRWKLFGLLVLACKLHVLCAAVCVEVWLCLRLPGG